jgi:aspartate aminotransferase-like enzyme
LCEAYGIKAAVIDVEWGQALNLSLVKEQLEKDKSIKAVFSTLCETSTGVTFDIKGLAEMIKETDAVLAVDAISGLGTIDLSMDAWGVDVVVSGSQKGLMLPPGLGFISLSKKAWKLVEESKCPKYYFDLKKAKKAVDKTDTPFTPAIGLIRALNEALGMLHSKGLERNFAYYRRLAMATRAAVTALGLQLFSPHVPSDAVTSVKVPEGIDGAKLVKTMRDEYGVTIAGGQAQMKGKLIRIAHMGYINEFDIVLCISCLEKVLNKMGYVFDLGSGVKAAEEVFLKD